MNPLITRVKRHTTIVLSVAALSLIVFSPMAQANPVKQTMNEMKHAFNSAMNSTSIAEFAQYEARLQDSTNKASHLSYNDNPSTYRQGMQELQRGLDRVNLDIKAGDLASAKRDLHSIIATKKHYHDLLN